MPPFLSAFVKTSVAFLKKDYQTEISYRFHFLMQFIIPLLFITAFYYMSAVIQGAKINALEPYGGSLFAFILIGVAFIDYIGTAIRSFAANIREGQMIGTLEIVLLSPVGLPTIILCSALWSYFVTTIKILVYLSAAVILFGLDLKNANLSTFLTILLLSILCFTSIGIFYASFIMVIKKGESLMGLVGIISVLLSGVFFPVSLLPEWLRSISGFIPLTYSLEVARLSLLQGASIGELFPQIMAMVGFCILFLPLAVVAFQISVKKAKVDGTLAQY